MIAKRMIGKQLGKGVFEIAKEVKETEAKFGKDNVVNSTIGTFYGEDEELLVLDTVDKTYRKLTAPNIFGYASGISGGPNFKKAAKKNVLGIYETSFDKSYIDVVATPGGTGAISSTIKGYMDEGQTVLLPSFMWESYKNIVASHGLNSEIYSLFDGEGFNIKDFSEKILNMAKTQHRVMAIINDPCQNPTGYCMTYEEWAAVVAVLKEAAQYGEVILINDIAYIDYDFRGADESRKYMTLFNGLPENILIVITYSISKSFTSYGLRAGAQVAISSSKEVIEEFDVMSSFLCRTTWSNISRGAMELLSEIYGNPELLKQVEGEREEAVKLLEKRAEIFVTEAKNVGLEICPFRSGFFVTVPLKENRAEIVADLKAKNIFVLPTLGGIRIAICSVPCKKIGLLPKAIAESIAKFNK